MTHQVLGQMTIYEIGPPIRIRLGEQRRAEKQINAAREVVDVLDRLSHLSMLNGLVSASESEEHRPELVEHFDSELKLNEAINNTQNAIESVESGTDKKFYGLLNLLGIATDDMPKTERALIYDKAKEDFLYKYAGPSRKNSRDLTRQRLIGLYEDAVDGQMPRRFREDLAKKQKDRLPFTNEAAA